MRKLSILLALVAGLFAFEAKADFTGKNAAAATITFKNPGDCTSVVCVPVSHPYAFAIAGTGWTSGTALNTTQSILPAGYGAPAVLVQLQQTSTISGGAVTFQGTYDGTNWVSIPVAQLLNPNTLAAQTNPYTLVASTNQPFLILTQGYQQIRLLLSTVITGSATVTPQITLLPYNPVVSALLNPLSAGSAIIGKVGIDQTTSGTTNGVMPGGVAYETVAASQIAQVLGGAGATGDYLSHCVIYPVTTGAGAVTVFDNANAPATNVITFTSGTLSNLAPIPIPVGAISTAGAWKVTTGANVTVTCYGKFT